MRRIVLALAIVLFHAFTLSHFHPLNAAAEGTACADLTSLKIPGVSVISSSVVLTGSAGRGAQPQMLPPYCRVMAQATPVADSHINIEIWIPVDNWNGKLLGVGNGGFAGSLPTPAMASALVRGYATVGTDTGHAGDNLDFGDGHPEKIVDWSYRAVHVMTDVAKLVIRDHRGKFPDHAYFEGCSTGGQQALSEAQRFPQDYDGIVAGDPGHNRVRLIIGFLWSWMAAHPDGGASVLTPETLATVTKAAVAACDAQDGVKDGLISDPRACKFDPSTLVVTSGGGSDPGLTPTQAAAIKKIYDGAKNPRTGEQIFPGWARGSEQGWGSYITNPREPVRFTFFPSFVFHDPRWDMRSFDWDHDVAYADSVMADLSATSRDLSAFKARGGKLVMYTGMADPVVPPQDTFNYYEDVAKRFGGLASTQAFFRFFPIAGMGHCGGGPAPVTFDALGALEQWVEKGNAPGRLSASRPICMYPSLTCSPSSAR